MPLVVIPTWATWTKEWGAGLEISRVLTEEDLGAFFFSFLSLLDLKRKGWKTKTRVMAWQHERALKLTMVPRPIRDFFVEDACFFVFVEAKSEHATLTQNSVYLQLGKRQQTYRSGEIVKERLVFRVLEDLGDGKCPNHTIGLHVNETKPVFLLETHTMTASLRRRRAMVCVSVTSEDQDSFELRVAPVQMRIVERRIVNSDASSGDHFLRARFENG